MWNRCGIVIIPYPLRNSTFVDDIHYGWLTLWLAFTLGPPLVHWVALFQVAISQVALSRYVPTLNESTKNRYPSPIGEPNPKDRLDRCENLLSLSITPHSCVEPMWDRIRKSHGNGENFSTDLEKDMTF